MPVRFICEFCKSRLTVSRRYAGQRGRCPNCKQRVQVPEISIADPLVSSAGGFAESLPDFRTDPQDDNPHSTENASSSDVQETQSKTNKSGSSRLTETIPIARWIVYTQAAFLGIVATTFFVFGLAVGNNTGEQATEVTRNTETVLGGLVVFRKNGNEEVDTGAVVLVLPVKNFPDPRPEPDSLVPDRFVPLDNPAIETIRELGGAVVRVDRIGRFQTKLRSGSYWVLVLSCNQSVEKPEIEKQIRADLGDYFFPVETLIGKRAYHWEKIRLTGGEQELPRITF